ncbi:MAG: hypothetical protein AVDCRST_MAG89-2620, partial [uncultured Gemmatimonadetes bacterium]
ESDPGRHPGPEPCRLRHGEHRHPHARRHRHDHHYDDDGGDHVLYRGEPGGRVRVRHAGERRGGEGDNGDHRHPGRVRRTHRHEPFPGVRRTLGVGRGAGADGGGGDAPGQRDVPDGVHGPGVHRQLEPGRRHRRHHGPADAL